MGEGEATVGSAAGEGEASTGEGEETVGTGTFGQCFWFVWSAGSGQLLDCSFWVDYMTG